MINNNNNLKYSLLIVKMNQRYKIPFTDLENQVLIATLESAKYNTEPLRDETKEFLRHQLDRHNTDDLNSLKHLMSFIRSLKQPTTLMYALEYTKGWFE